MTENENAPPLERRGAETSNAAQSSTRNKFSAPRPFLHRWRSAVWNSSLKTGSKIALLALAEFADAAGGSCYPSAETIGKLCRSTEKTVRANLASAVERGYVRRFQKTSSKAWAQYSYQLVIPPGADTRRPTDAHAADKSSGATLTGPGEIFRSGADESLTSDNVCSGSFRHLVKNISTRAPEAFTDELALDLAHRTGKEGALMSDHKAVWSEGMRFLLESGVKERRARSVIGKLRKLLCNDDVALREIIRAAKCNLTAEPIAWLMGAARYRSRKSSSFARFDAASDSLSLAQATRALELLGVSS
jgi:hypothetical protein